MKHRLVAIGGLGQYACFLDISREEAIRRYRRYWSIPPEQVIEESEDIREFCFNDAFGAYSVLAEEGLDSPD